MVAPEWARVLDGLHIGDHVILLYNDFSGLEPPVTRFMMQGLHANELVVALLPIQEMDHWRGILDHVLTNAGSGPEAGSVQIIPILPSRLTEDTGPLDIVSIVRRVLKDALAEGRTGVRVVGRLAPALFDKGFERNAVAIEKFAAQQRFPMKVMCLYDATQFAKAPAAFVSEVVAAHTHSIAHVSEDVYLVEAV